MEKIEIAKAAEIAGINAQRLNEHISAGYYPCAPETRPGVARQFTQSDVLALWVYTKLLEEKSDPSEAGRLACRFLNFIDDHPNAERALLVRSHLSPSWVLPRSIKRSEEMFGATNIISKTEWHLKFPRLMIAHAFKKEG